MKPLYYLIFLLFILNNYAQAQDEIVLWAKSYTVANCVEMGGLAVDSSDNIIIAGVHEAPFSLPFKGDVYLKKTDADGNLLWQSEMVGDLIIGDVAAQNNDIIISGQAYGLIQYKGQEYGGDPYYLYVFRLDALGNVIWAHFDQDKLGTYSNIAVSNNNQIVVHARKQSNQGDWILVFDQAGNVVQSRLLHPTITMIDDLAFYQDYLYMSGDLNGFSSVVIDTVFIPQSPLESTAFVLALDNNLVAQWVSIDTTLNNSNGKVEANENGVFVFQENLEPPFNISSNLKHFDFEGNKINEVSIPLFASSAALLPDMTLTGDRIALFVKNSFSSNSFKVLIYNNDLEIVNEKTISGSSDQYSNHIHYQNKNFIIGHIYESSLNLNDELSLPWEGPGKQPYIAKIGAEEVVISGQNTASENPYRVFPNPANRYINLDIPEGAAPAVVRVVNITGKTMLEEQVNAVSKTIDVSRLPRGIYFLQIASNQQTLYTQKIMIK